MPEQQQPEVPVFGEYACSLGTVINHEAGSYHIRTPDGRVIGIVANGDLSAENVEADIVCPGIVTAPVPAEVSPWQIRRALNAAGLRPTVEAAIAAADQDSRDGWEFASSIRRDNPLLNALAAQLGLSAEQVDNLFRAAAALN